MHSVSEAFPQPERWWVLCKECGLFYRTEDLHAQRICPECELEAEGQAVAEGHN